MAEDSEKTDKELRDELAERIMEEESYKHLNLVLQAERRIIKLIFHENDRNKLLEKICSILIENRGYTCVWIITFTGKQKTISMAEAGISQGYDTLIKLAEDGNLPSCTKRSAGDPGMKIIRDMEKECKGCPIFRSEKSISALTTHFEYGDWSSGVMTVYLPSMFIDNVEEQNLLQEIISDIAFALQRIEESEKHKYAEMEFHEIERKYKTIIESSIDTIIQFDTEGNFLYINPAGCKMFGRSHEEFVQMKFENLFDEEWNV